MKSSKNNLKFAILSGPTATGKSSNAYHYAKKHQLEIINFDSLLFYQGLNIGTAKPTADELSHVKHHLIDICPLEENFNAADFVRLSRDILLRQKKDFLLVGGSGFYLKALLYGMYEDQQTSTEVLHQSQELYDREGINPFLKILQKSDPDSFSRLHQNDHYRIRRAVEFYWQNHKPFSSNKKDFEKEVPYYQKQNWNFIHLYFDMDKLTHFEYIQKRTQMMLKKGLISEVENLLQQNNEKSLPKSLQSIGYKEVIQFITEQNLSLKELEELINIHTRQLAKAQRTFFRFFQEKLPFNPIHQLSEIESVLDSHFGYNGQEP